MKILLTSVAISTILTGSAIAADMRMPVKAAPAPVVAPFSWTGFYIGAHGGYGWGDSEEVFLNDPNEPGFLGTQTYDIKGPLAGGVLGYNWQAGQFVLGLEVEGNWTDIKGTSAEINVGDGDTYDTRVRWYGTVKGRAGLAFDRSLIYATGGFAYGKVRHRYTDPPDELFSRTEKQTGWVVGAGLEYAFASNWSAKIEYNFVDLGDGSIQYSASQNNRSEWNDQFHVIKAGINFRFGGFGGPVVARY